MHVAYFDDVSWADGQESKIPETLPFVPFAIFGRPAGDDRKQQRAVLAFAIFFTPIPVEKWPLSVPGSSRYVFLETPSQRPSMKESRLDTLQSKMNLTGLDIFQRAECRLPSLSCASAHFSADLSRRSSRHTPHPPPNANLRLCPELSCACAYAGWAGLCTAFLMANHLTLLLTDCVETSVNFCWFAEHR